MSPLPHASSTACGAALFYDRRPLPQSTKAALAPAAATSGGRPKDALPRTRRKLAFRKSRDRTPMVPLQNTRPGYPGRHTRLKLEKKPCHVAPVLPCCALTKFRLERRSASPTWQDYNELTTIACVGSDFRICNALVVRRQTGFRLNITGF